MAYASNVERELAARLQRELSAEPDFTEENNARLADARLTRLFDECKRGVLGRRFKPFQADAVDRKSVGK